MHFVLGGAIAFCISCTLFAATHLDMVELSTNGDSKPHTIPRREEVMSSKQVYMHKHVYSNSDGINLVCTADRKSIVHILSILNWYIVYELI